MTPEQATQLCKLAAAWSLTSFLRGNDQAHTPALTDNDREAANNFHTYLQTLTTP